MPKPIKIDLPYPSLNQINKDYKTAYVLAPAFAGGHGELNAILQYIYHFFNFNGVNEKQIADTLIGIAITEMEHLKILGELLYKLGVDPVFTKIPPSKYDFYTTKTISYSKLPVKMLLDDLSGEMLAVKDYQHMVDNICNEQVSSVICRIILDEELHIKVLKDLLKRYYNGLEYC